MKYARAALALASFLIVAKTFAVTGAIVIGVRLEGQKATITILNTAKHNITCYSVHLKEHHADGTEYDGHSYTEDLGTESSVAPGSTREAHVVVDSEVKSVEAEVVVVVYDDRTAQVKPGEERELEGIKETRKKLAANMAKSADELGSKDPDAAEQLRQKAKAVAQSADIRRVQ
jgi:thiol:disulfide interchange protein